LAGAASSAAEVQRLAGDSFSRQSVRRGPAGRAVSRSDSGAGLGGSRAAQAIRPIPQRLTPARRKREIVCRRSMAFPRDSMPDEELLAGTLFPSGPVGFGPLALIYGGRLQGLGAARFLWQSKSSGHHSHCRQGQSEIGRFRMQQSGLAFLDRWRVVERRGRRFGSRARRSGCALANVDPVGCCRHRHVCGCPSTIFGRNRLCLGFPFFY